MGTESLRETQYNYLEVFNTHPRFVLPGGSDGEESACNMGDLGLIPGLGRSPGEGTGLPIPVPWPREF